MDIYVIGRNRSEYMIVVVRNKVLLKEYEGVDESLRERDGGRSSLPFIMKQRNIGLTSNNYIRKEFLE